MTKQRITLISLTGLIVFGILLGGQILYTKGYVESNILNQSKQIPGVNSAKVVTVNGLQELDVVTNNISDLRKTSLALEKLAGDKPIRFQDQRNYELETLFEQMQFPLQEAMIRGNFTDMANVVKKQADQAGVHLSLAMDSDSIYLTLTKQNAQLVEVLERHGQGIYLPSEVK